MNMSYIPPTHAIDTNIHYPPGLDNLNIVTTKYN